MTNSDEKRQSHSYTERKGIWALGTLPVACTVVVGINTLYILLVAIGNITDFDTNQAFVQHVLAMDTTNFGGAPGEGLDDDVMWRAITNPTIQNIGYIGVIIWESLAAIVLCYGVFLWLSARKSRNFDSARRISTIGLLMIVILFMGGFITVGGEWFQMWRSTAWNGLEPAFRNSVLALFGIVLMQLDSRQWRILGSGNSQEMLDR